MACMVHGTHLHPVFRDDLLEHIAPQALAWPFNSLYVTARSLLFAPAGQAISQALPRNNYESKPAERAPVLALRPARDAREAVEVRTAGQLAHFLQPLLQTDSALNFVG